MVISAWLCQLSCPMLPLVLKEEGLLLSTYLRSPNAHLLKIMHVVKYIK